MTNVRSALLGVLFILLFISTINGLDLINDNYFGTYGSDAMYYHINAVNLLKGFHDEFLSPAFVWYQSILLYLFPSREHVFFIYLNCLVYVFICLILMKSLDVEILQNASSQLIFLLLSNGIILWVVIRGVKEVLVFLSIAVFLYLLKFNLFLKFLGFVIFAALHYYLKPSGLAFAVVVVLTAMFLYKASLKIIFVTSLFMCITLFYLYENFQFIFQVLKDHQELSLREQGLADVEISLFSFAVAPIRFILGPGPIKSFEQILYQDLFISSTLLGDVLIFFGSFAWWVMLAIFVHKFIKYKFSFSFSEYVLMSYSLLYVLSYSVSYLGTGDTRHRAILYFCTLPIFIHVVTKHSHVDRWK